MVRSKTTRSPNAQRALVWSFANTAIGKFGTVLISVIIARLLGPDEFATFAVAMVALAAVLSFNELGVSLAIVRWEGDPRSIGPTVTTISVVASLVFFAAGLVAAPEFAQAMGDPGATDVVRLMLVCVPLNGLVATPAAMLQREYQQGRRTVADQVNIWLGAGISIALVILGWGAMSLAIGRVVASVVFSIMLILYSPAPLRFGWHRDLVGPLLRFGLPLAGASIVVFTVGYADQIVVGSVIGAKALGFYLLAFNLSSWPVTLLSQPIRAVAPAAFARIQTDRDQMGVNYRAAYTVVFAVAAPVCAFIAAAADPIVTLVFGAEWVPAAAALQWLALAAVVRILFELSYDFLAVKRRSTVLMAIQIAWLTALVPALLVGAQLSGIGGVAAAQFVVATLILIVGYGWALSSAGVDAWALVRSSLLPVVAGVVAGAGSILITRMVDSDLVADLTAGFFSLAVMGMSVWMVRSSIRTLRGATRMESSA
ncbi:oligosaccharide flippase family protein [Gordonia rhizosphera]|uniref:Putative polysaccharide biosynthesis protein n=1 Tax=Gordonia rhizosphera NBRC 16068 TaxID=1108045 RepID=K6WRA8_9ACTN|nr:oligosaccharide flippase family protein [Gordonia rhizosphera]GAB89094.1 putative polysaccharide biosynthesis protein [Gordonia rhizosphera NBRC 16068]